MTNIPFFHRRFFILGTATTTTVIVSYWISLFAVASPLDDRGVRKHLTVIEYLRRL